MSEWIEHDGKGCPLTGDVLVDVRWDNEPEHRSFCRKMSTTPVEARHVAGWDSVTHYRIVEQPQAHMMSAPERKHVSDAAWEAIVDNVDGQWGPPMRKDMEQAHRIRGTVQITVAEHDELLAAKAEIRRAYEKIEALTDKYDAAEKVVNLSAELQARTEAWEGEEWKMRAEVERLKDSDAFKAKQVRELEEHREFLQDQIERLRKGVKGEVVADRRGRAGNGDVVGDVRDSRGIHLVAASAMAANLDPRLGTPQPEGEPVQPMSAKKPYRWGMM